MKKTSISRVILVLTFSFIVLDSLFLSKKIFLILQLKRELRNISSRIELVKKENTNLRATIEKLHSDPIVIETIAREELNMARVGEVIYQLPIKKSKGR